MNKGFIFSMDAAFGVIVLSLALSALFFLASQSQENAAPSITLKRLAGDSLSLLDSNGTLSSLNATLVDSTLAASLPPQFVFNLSVEYFDYTSSGFMSVQNLTAGSLFPTGQDSAISSKVFLVYNDSSGTPKHYGLAKIRVWRQ